MSAIAKKSSLNRGQILKVILVCIQKYVRQNWEGFNVRQQKAEAEKIKEVKESKKYKDTVKFMKDVFDCPFEPVLKYCTSSAHAWVSATFGNRHTIMLDCDFVLETKPKKIEILGITIAEHYINDNWEKKMKNRITNRINEMEVDTLLQNKKFTLDLNEFMSKLGLPGEVCTFASKEIGVKS